MSPPAPPPDPVGAVPLPTPGEELLEPPTSAESEVTARGVATAVAPPGGLTELQRVLLEVLFDAMTATTVDLREFEPVSAAELARHLAPRNLQFRTRGVQIMLLGALVLRPLPPEVVANIRRYAQALSVEEGMIDVAQRFAEGSLGLAALDFERNGYTSDWTAEDAGALHASKELAAAWQQSAEDEALAARWEALADLPEGTLGRAVSQMYRSRGFAYPGAPGSAPPLLAQHDWVHVVADFGTTVESELEVFAFIARANDDMRAFSLLAMVVSLFETGYLRTGAGLFQYDQGHLSSDPGVAVRMADAMRRGAFAHDIGATDGSVDFLRVDWFALAPMTIDEVRTAFGVRPKAPAAVEAGSVGPFAPGGISPFQLRAGRARAEAEGREYDSFGAATP